MKIELTEQQRNWLIAVLGACMIQGNQAPMMVLVMQALKKGKNDNQKEHRENTETAST